MTFHRAPYRVKSKDPRIVKSQKQERDGMRRLGGVTNSRSGAGPFRKNDGRTARDNGNELVEFKRTDNKRQITIKYEDLRDLANHALVEGREWVFLFELGGRRFAILAEDDYLSRTRGISGNSETIRRLDSSPGLVRQSEMPVNREYRAQSVLQRLQRQRRNTESEIDMRRDRQGNNSHKGIRHPVPGKERVPRLGLGARRGAERGMGGNVREGTSSSKTGDQE